MPARWSLRTRLVIVMVALVAAALIISGLTTITLLRGYLLQQVDRQLVAAASLPGVGRPAPRNGDLPNFAIPDDARSERSSAQASPGAMLNDYYIALLNSSGEVVASEASAFTSAEPDLPRVTSANVASYDEQPFTVESVDGGPQWRVVATPVRGGTVLVARDVGELAQTVRQLSILLAAVGVTVVVIISAVGLILVRRNLAPLGEVEQAATDIAAGDMNRRVPTLHPDTEMGKMSTALNVMLDQLHASLRQEQQALQESRASEERMKTFIADISHELRTPLTSVSGFSQLYQRGAISEDQVGETFARIDTEANRMSALVNDLLLLVRLDQRLPLELSEVNVLELVTQRVSAVAVAHPSSSIDIQVDTELAPNVIGDERKIGQMVTNLVTNALLHGGGEVTVTIDHVPAESGETVGHRAGVILRFTDHGPGLADADKSRIFQRFVRADQSRSRSTGGTGLGLSIVAAIVEAHHGTIDVSDTPGGGATFTVFLPESQPDR